MIGALHAESPQTSMVNAAGFRPGVTAGIYENLRSPDASVVNVDGIRTPAQFGPPEKWTAGSSFNPVRMVMRFMPGTIRGPRIAIAKDAGRTLPGRRPQSVGAAAQFVPVSEPPPFYEGFGFRR